MSDKQKFPDIFGITDPNVASKFATENAVTLRLGNIGKNTARDVYNVLVPGVLGGTVGAVGRLAGGTLRGVSNVLLGIPWAGTQWTAKKIENLAQSPEKLRWNDAG